MSTTTLATSTASATTCNPAATPSVPIASLQAILPDIKDTSNYCAFSFPEAAPDLKTCCVTGQNSVYVQGCTQACQTDKDLNAFTSCVTGLAPQMKDTAFVCWKKDGTTATPSSSSTASGSSASSGAASATASEPSASASTASASKSAGTDASVIKGIMVWSVALLALCGAMM